MHTNLLGDLGHVSQINKVLLSQSLSVGDIVVDATLGNGSDALTLLTLIGITGHLYGFDIQAEAIDITKKRLCQSGFENVTYIIDSHANMEKYLNPAIIKGFVFNLGYLPKGEKQITTKWESTQEAIRQAMELVVPEGFISIMTYPGHENGKVEDEMLNQWLSELPQKEFQVSHMRFINQANQPPKLYWITKRPTGKKETT